MKKQLTLYLTIILTAALLCACAQVDASGKMKDGYYSAEPVDFDDHGWKEFLTIYVKNNTIVTVEYNAKNPSGFIKSWDMDYMRTMNRTDNTYPNEYTRKYAAMLLDSQGIEGLDAITGATHSYDTFLMLAEAVINQAKLGDARVAFITLSDGTVHYRRNQAIREM